MHSLHVIVVLFLLFSPSQSLKFLFYDLKFSTSHINFINALGDTLLDAGHEVFANTLADVLIDGGHEVVAISNIVNEKLKDVGSTRVQRIVIPKQNDTGRLNMRKLSNNAWESRNIIEMLIVLDKQDFYSDMVLQCDAVLLNKELIDRIKNEKFDAAFATIFDRCSYALFHLAGITKTAMVDAHSTVSEAFFVTGAPNNYAYVPGRYSPATDRMSLWQRVDNFFIDQFANWATFTFDRFMNKHMQKRVEGLPDIRNIMSNVSLLFLNRVPLLDFPTATTHKIVDIGGISVRKSTTPLDEELSRLLSVRPHTVLIAFGTISLSMDMPEQYKESIVEAARRLPEVTFIWKYENATHNISRGLANLYTRTWIPQKKLLHDSRLSAFITHAGLSSTLEACMAGIPVIAVPTASDQYRNAEILRRNGVGFVLQKSDLGNTDKLESTLRAILTEDRYKSAAQKVAKMLQDQPFTAKELFVKNMEFLAAHGPLHQLNHYGTELNTVEYYGIDIFVVILTIAAVVFYLIAKLAQSILILLVRIPSKLKTE